MSTEEPDAERSRDLERFLTFVDAAVAIAITLLVLPLVDLSAEVTHGGSVAHLISTHRPQFGSFALSFVVIGRLWWAQHVATRTLVVLDGRIFVLLMVWASTIVFLPFPTALVAVNGEQTVTKALYIGTSAVSMTSLAVLAALMRRYDRLTTGQGSPAFSGAVTNALLLVLALVLAVSFPVLSYWPMLLLTIDKRVRWVAGRLRKAR